MNWQSSSSRRQSPPGWCLGRTILGAGAGRRARRRGERTRQRVARREARVAEASGGGRSDPGAAPRSPPAARAIQWTSEAGRSRALNLDGGLSGLRWAVSQCVGQWEGGRKRGCARLLGGGELLKVQCESGDISHLLETLPNYLLEVPEIKAAGGESLSSYLRRSEREGEGDRGGGWGRRFGGGEWGRTPTSSPARRCSQAAWARPGWRVCAVCVCAWGGVRWGHRRRRRAARGKPGSLSPHCRSPAPERLCKRPVSPKLLEYPARGRVRTRRSRGFAGARCGFRPPLPGRGTRRDFVSGSVRAYFAATPSPEL